MNEFRIVSIDEPFARSPETARRAVRMVLRAGMMDLLPDLSEGADLELNADFVCGLVHNAQEAGIARGVSLEPLSGHRATPNQVEWLERVDDLVNAITAALDESPYPEGEWGEVRDRIGEDLLSRLLSTSPSSIRRYATGTRPTPDDVAWRLHALSRIVAALLGSYNDYGVRRWFERPRAQLDGETPAAIIEAAETEDDAGLQRVFELADGLVGAAPAT
jgi:hypothetical protein